MASPSRGKSLLQILAFSLALIFAVLGLWVSFGRGDLTRYANLGDLYPRWYGAREALLQGRNPYSPEVSAEIQIAYYGHPLAIGEGKDEQRFAYPAYAVFYLLPTLWMPFEQVRYTLAFVLLGLIVATIICWVRIFYGRSRWKAALFASLIGIASLPTIQAIKIQQLAVLVIALLSFGIFAATRKKLVLSGALFALATIKPQLVIAPLIWMLFWSLADWKARKGFVLGFGTTLAALMLLAEAVIPGWPSFFFQGLFAYGNYTNSSGALVILFGKTGYGLALALMFPVVVTAWRARNLTSDTYGFLFTCALLFCTVNACQPWLAAPFNQFLLIPALVLLFRERTMIGPALAVALLVPAAVAALSNTTLPPEYLAIAVAIQLALSVCVLLALLPEVWAKAEDGNPRYMVGLGKNATMPPSVPERTSEAA